jgi:Ca2+-binding EF-hand superfamily protein
VFPEGCCSNGTTVLQFKTGAFSPGLPVAPVALRFPVGPTGLDVSFAGPGPGIPILFLRMLAAPWTPMHVTWLPPVRPATPPPAGGELGEADAAAFAKCARKAIADSLGVTLSTFGLDDVGMEMAAQQTKMKPEDAIVELETLRELVRVRPVEAKRIVKMFAQVQQEGTVDFQQFAKLLLDIRKAEKMQEAANTEEKKAAATPVSDIAPTPSDALRLAASEPPPSLPPSSPRAAQLEQQFLRKLFDVFDVHHTGKLHLRELLVGLALLDDRGLGGQPDEHQELLRVAFQLLDEDGRGRVNAERFARVFHFLLPTLAEERYAELFAVAAAGGTEITEEKFLVWARQPEVFPTVLKLRERLFGLRQGDWLLFLDPSKSAAEGKLRTGKGGGAPKRN